MSTSSLDEAVPGTELLVDINRSHDASHIGTGFSDIILIPPPTDCGRDPLAWPKWKKYYQLFLVALYACLFSYSENLLGAAWTEISKETGVSLTNMNGGSSLNFLLLGFVNIWWIPTANKIGRRPVFLITMIIVMCNSIWVGKFHGTGQWFATNFFGGIGTSAYEAVVQLSVFDMFFVHDRGRMLSVYISGQQLGAILGLITGGKIADTVGWRWGEYIVAIIGAVVLLLFIFSFEETLFPRFLFSSEVPVIIGRTSQDSDESTRELHNGKTAKGGDIASTAPLGNENDSSNAPQAQPDSYWTSSDKFPKRSYAELLKLWTYYPQNRTTFWQYFRRPFLLATFPNIIIAGFIFAFGSTAGIVSFNTISEILTAPPYNWSTTKTGLSFLAAVIGNIIGWALGALSDHLVIHIARRNGGVKEPEMRLYVLSISVILVPLGYLLYGFGAQSHLPWPTITLGILCMTAHQVLACTVATAYAMECFPGVSASLVTLLAIYSSVINFGVSYSVQPIIEGVGYGWTFFIFGILVLGAMGAAGWAVVRGKEWRRRCAGRYYGILGEVGDGEGGGVR